MMRQRLPTVLMAVSVCLWAWGSPAPAARAAGPDPVERWARFADALGGGYANWHTLAIMHMAMHDSLNAIRPEYRRWAPAAPDEPSAAGASPDAAMAAAARQVLVSLHPNDRAEIERVFAEAMSQVPPGLARDAGAALGASVGAAWLRRRAQDGFVPAYTFATSEQAGSWRPTPPSGRNSRTTMTVPFLSADRIEPGAPPPPALGSERYRRDLDEVRRIGGRVAPARDRAATEAAGFWAFQLSQRGYLDLGLRLLEQHKPPLGAWDEARILSKLTTALADSAIIVWAEKEHFHRWRPITAIRMGGFGVTPDPAWEPLVETPYFPEYPAGHTSDCLTGAGLLASVFGADAGPIEYRALGPQNATPLGEGGAGQHTQSGHSGSMTRSFADLQDSAEQCGQSRIWAGAHFRSSNDEARRIAAAIVRRASAAVPPVP